MDEETYYAVHRYRRKNTLQACQQVGKPKREQEHPWRVAGYEFSGKQDWTDTDYIIDLAATNPRTGDPVRHLKSGLECLTGEMVKIRKPRKTQELTEAIL